MADTKHLWPCLHVQEESSAFKSLDVSSTFVPQKLLEALIEGL